MSLTVLVDRAEIRAAYEALERRWADGAMHVQTRIGWQGGQHPAVVLWRDDVGVWLHVGFGQTETRYWCLWSTEYPPPDDTVPITVEINAPLEGVDLHTGGMLARDADGRTFLLHSGKVGGGREGVGKAAFLRFANGLPLESVSLPDGRTRKMVVVGRVDGEHSPIHIAQFVKEVQRFKNWVKQGQPKVPEIQSAQQPVFRPEFSGIRQPYEPEGRIEANCEHGVVVNELFNVLQEKGFQPGNDQRDLYVMHGARTAVLFEVKTACNTTCLYEAVGQLMLHGANQNPPPVRVAVLPDEPDEKTTKAFRRLGIRCVVYEWQHGKIVFDGLEQVCQFVTGRRPRK